MPILGHAFVGLATAIATAPPENARRGRAAPLLWIPVAVGLAYAPDVAERLLTLLTPHGDVAAHSFLFAVLFSIAVAPVLGRLFGIRGRAAFAITLFSIGCHDLLDMLQATDRAPLWPLSRRTVGVAVLPGGARAETAAFGALLASFLIGGWTASREKTRRLVSNAVPGRGSTAAGLVAAAATGLLFIVPYGVHKLRSLREGQLEEATALLGRERYFDVLPLLDQAERWPSAARRGRIDYLRAEVYQGLGDRRRAEEHYLRSLKTDPHYFWLVADLAVFYASGDEPRSERGLKAKPYVERLEREFSDQPELSQVLDRVRRKLQAQPKGSH
jgi:membrane-bound metal-dependent hydrolase YbcI (DUF457 family)